MRWDTKPDNRIRRTSPYPAPTRFEELRGDLVPEPEHPPSPGAQLPVRTFARPAALSVAGEHRAHECPFLAEHAIAHLPHAVAFEEVRTGAEQLTVLLVGSAAGQAEQFDDLLTQPFC